MKKTLAIILTALMILSCMVFSTSAAAWDGSSKAEFTGTGTAADPYVIDSAEKLAKLAELVNAGETYAGKYFTQTADIDLGGKEWTPIGTSAKPFSGVYNGLDNKITGLYISNVISQCGLFGFIVSTADAEAGIANLKLEGKMVSDGMTVDAGFGLLCGWVCKDGTDNFKKAFVQNVVVDGDIKVTNCGKQPRLGGVIGFAFNAEIVNVTFNGKIDYSCSAVSRVGGIIGQTNRSIVKNCVNNADIKVVGTAGNQTGAGIIAIATYKVDDYYLEVEGNVNNGKIEVYSAAAAFCAGIFGQPYSSNAKYFYKIKNNLNTGDIYGNSTTTSTSSYVYVGGIYAYLNKNNVEVSGNVNTGNVSYEGGAGNRTAGIGGCYSKDANADLATVVIDGNTSSGKAFGYLHANVVPTNTVDNADDATLSRLAASIKAEVKGCDTKINGFPTEAIKAADPVNPPVNPPQTGDTVVFAVAAALVAILGAGLVIRKKIED